MLGLEWMQHHISLSALHSKAYTWLRSLIHALMQHDLMGAWQPNISDSFFEALVFKLFTNAACWATWELTNDANLKSYFTPLHFVTTLCGISRP
jgi:hypothetical protein